MPFQQVLGAALEDYGAGVLFLPEEAMDAWITNRTNMLTIAAKAAMEPGMKDMAKKLGKITVAREDGVTIAADRFEQHMKELYVRKKRLQSQQRSEEL